MSALFDPALEKIYAQDREYLEKTLVPIVTVFGTFTEDLKNWHHQKNNNTSGDIVLSRAHYSMANAVASSIWRSPTTPQPTKSWLVDPTNFVSLKGYKTVDFTEEVAKVIARHPLLKGFKQVIDRFGRKKLPIIDSITPPLLYLTENIQRPIISFHIAAGNILARTGKTVLQIVTDPHIREEYLLFAHLPSMQYCVFDQRTKTEFLEKAAIHEIEVDPDRIHVTGPPVDHRIIKFAKHKHPWRSGSLKLVIATGGLGTNKHEILALLQSLLPLTKKTTPSKQPLLKLVVYAGTQQDIYEEAVAIIRSHGLGVGKNDQLTHPVRVLYHPQIVDANELLIMYGFSWADGFLTKPSGDMAYDAACSGSFMLTLHEWGPWEHAIRNVFEQKNISRQAQISHIRTQLQSLMSAQGRAQSWIEKAMHASQKLGPDFTAGVENIFKTHQKLQHQK